MKITRSQKNNLDDVVGVTTSLLAIAGAFPALGDYSVVANATAAGFELLYIALQRMGIVQIDKIKSLQVEYKEVIQKSFDCAKKGFSTHDTQQFFEEVNSRIRYQIKQKKSREYSSFDDIYNAVEKAIIEYYKGEQERPSGIDIKAFFDKFEDCFDIEMSSKPELSCNFQLKELRLLRKRVTGVENEVNAIKVEFSTVKNRFNQRAFIQHEIVFRQPSFPVKEYVVLDGIISTIDNKLEHGRPLLICAPGGTGKSELCRKYYAEKEKESKFVWFDFSNSIKETLISAANESKLIDPMIRDVVFNSVFEKLKALGKSATVIIDNVLCMQSEDVNYLCNMGCRVIISSRENFEALEGNLETLELDFLPISLCREVFQGYSKKTVFENEIEELDKIIHLAGRHTLAIELLAKIYSGSPNYKTLNKLLEALKEHHFKLPELIKQNHDNEYREFMAHFTKLFNLAGVLVETDRVHVLKNMAIIGSIPTPRKQLLKWIGEEYQKAYKELVDGSWIFEQNYMVIMHDLIIEAVKEQVILGYKERKKMIEIMTQDLHFDKADLAQFSPPYFQQNRAVGEFFLGENKQNIELMSFYRSIAAVLRAKGEFKEAQRYFEQVLEICKRKSHIKYFERVIALNDLASVIRSRGEYQSALKYNTEALRICFLRLHWRNKYTAETYDDLAGVLKDKGNFKVSIKNYRRAISIKKTVFGKRSVEAAKTYNNIGVVLKDKGYYKKAIKYYELALDIRKMEIGDHPYTATTYNNLADVLRDMGDYKNALINYFEAKRIREEVLGETHSATATTYNNMADVYSAMRDFEKAEKYYTLAKNIREKVLDPHHSAIATTYNNYARVFRDKGDYEWAKEYFSRALDIRIKALGTKHSATATSYDNFGNVFQAGQQYEQALMYYKKAKKIRAKVLGKHPATATTYNNIASIYQIVKATRKSLKYYKRAMIIRCKKLGEAHPATAASFRGIASVYMDKEEYGKALRFYIRAYKSICEVFGNDNDRFLDYRNDLENCYYKSGGADGTFDTWISNYQ